MEENEIMEGEVAQNQLPDDVLSAINAKVAELKAANPKIKTVFPIVVDGNPDYDEKERYIGYFSQPSFQAFSRYITISQKDQVVAMRGLATDCFLGGDRELIEDESLLLFGLMGQLPQIISIRHGQIIKNSKAGK